MDSTRSTVGRGVDEPDRSPPALAPGDRLSGRYTVIRFIGRGGMGEVYEAEDSLLQQRVALKLLPDSAFRDARAVERFRREVQLARQVSHPNVCRVYDMGCEPAAEQPAESRRFFLTMELLRGETLSARIARDEQIAPAEALPILAGIAAGLSAAHAQGVLHRDLKSSNVILIGSGDAGTEPPVRAVITDFGLARMLDARRDSGKYTSEGVVVGTPEYMSPEQLQGADLSPSSDIYSFGVIMYEMVTGSVPFSSASPIAAAVKRAVERPPSPKLLAPHLDDLWESTILRCLSQRPEERCQSALEAVDALSCAGRTEGRGIFASPFLGPHVRRRWIIGVSLAVGVLVAGIGAHRWYQSRRLVEGTGEPPPAGAVSGPPIRTCVAVLGFRNLTGLSGHAWISTALTEMLSAELAAARGLRCLPGESIVRVRQDLRLSDADGYSSETLKRIRDLCGADHVVLGSYLAKGSPLELRLDVRVQDTSTGETSRVITLQSMEEDLLQLVSRAGSDLRAALGASPISDSEAAALAAGRPTRISAVRGYAEGLDRLWDHNMLGARDSLTRSIEADSHFPLSHLALSDTWLALGYSSLAEEEARKAYQLSSKLTRDERLSIEGTYRERALDWTKAIDAYATLWKEFPDSLEDGLRLAFAQIRAGRERDAMQTVAELQRLPRPLSADPRIPMAEASAAASLGDVRLQRDAAARAVQAARAAGARFLLADSLLVQGDAEQNAGHFDESLACYTGARELFGGLENRPGEVRALASIADIHREKGESAVAKGLYDEARAIYQELGDRHGESWTLSQVALVLRLEGDLPAADASLKRALGIAEEAGNGMTSAAVLNNLAVVAWLQGDRDRAAQLTTEGVTACRRIGYGAGECRLLGNFCEMLLQDGDLTTAERVLGEAEGIAEQRGGDALHAEILILGAQCDRLRGEIGAARSELEKAREIVTRRGSQELEARSLHELGMILYEQGDLREARQKLEQSVAIREAVGGGRRAAASRIAIGAILIGEGNFSAADEAARAVLSLGKGQRPENPGAAAQDLLARSFLAQGDVRQAEAAAQQATSMLAQGAPLDLRLAVTITMGRVRSRSGNPAQASAILAQAGTEADRTGLKVLALEARMASADAARAAGRRAEGVGVLNTVIESSGKLGLARLSREATAMRSAWASSETP